MNANIMEYTGSDGNVMQFTATTSIEAGTPYLVKPKEGNIIDQTYSDVTLTAQPAKSVAFGDYKFVATYSPKQLATDKTELFLTTDGKLGYPQTAADATLKGMRAYIQAPASANVALFVDGEGTITGIDTIDNSQMTIDNVYNLNGQRVTQPRKGLFIVNGKKLIIH